MPGPTDQLSSVNRSGYPLQIAIAHAVKARSRVHGWRVLYEEHSWRNPREEGFIDLVLEHVNLQVVLLIECKRLQNKQWTLLSPEGHAKPHRHARGLRTERVKGQVALGFPRWSDEPADPATPEAMFCVMPKDARDPTVERVGAELVSAAEALEIEERDYLNRRGGDSRRIYFAAIVTTADLSVCSFDPSSISLADGMIPCNAPLSPVHAVRITKQLSTQPVGGVPVAQFGQEADALVKAKERTVFVINAAHLDEFLRDFDVDDREKE